MSKYVDFFAMGGAAAFEASLVERAARDWSMRTTFRLEVLDHEFDETNHVCEYVTAHGFGDVYVRRASEPRHVLVDVRDPADADRFYAYVIDGMRVSGHACEYVASIGKALPAQKDGA